MMQQSVIVQKWQSTARVHGVQNVLPDGCRDLIIRRRPGMAPVWFVSDLANRVARVAVGPGHHYCGYRLLPGARIDHAALLASVHDGLGDADITERLHHHVTPLPDVTEALHALSAGAGQGTGVAGVAAMLGVRVRSLQRLLHRHTGRSPLFWMRLARVRRTAALIGRVPSLAEMAHDQGFADQAHMTRELRHWLGVTPGQVARDAGWAGLHLGPGYGV